MFKSFRLRAASLAQDNGPSGELGINVNTAVLVELPVSVLLQLAVSRCFDYVVAFAPTLLNMTGFGFAVVCYRSRNVSTAQYQAEAAWFKTL